MVEIEEDFQRSPENSTFRITIDHKEKSKMDHPDHYNWLPGTECIDVVEHFDYNLGCVIKYVWRAGRKANTDKLTDLQKARWYIQREIDKTDMEATDAQIIEHERTLKAEDNAGREVAILPTDTEARRLYRDACFNLSGCWSGNRRIENEEKEAVRVAIAAFDDGLAGCAVNQCGIWDTVTSATNWAKEIRRLWKEMQERKGSTEKQSKPPELLPTDEQACKIIDLVAWWMEGNEAEARAIHSREEIEFVREVILASDQYAATDCVKRHAADTGGTGLYEWRYARKAEIIRQEWKRMRHGTDPTTT